MKKNLFFTIVVMMGIVFSYAQDGSETNPYPIKTKAHLISLAQSVNTGSEFYFNPADSTYAAEGDAAYKIQAEARNAHFKLMNDIVFNSGDVASCDGVKASDWDEWTMIGDTLHRFNGVFDGNFHVISGVYLVGTTEGTGLFGGIRNNAEIKNLGIVNSYISGVNATGGIVGDALSGKIEKCFFTGTIYSTGNYTGGIAGQIQAGAEINTCYASATIKSSGTHIGGIVGKILNVEPGCKLINLYSSSIVHGLFQFTGGIVGEDLGSSTAITNCSYDEQLIDLKSYTPYAAGTGVATNTMINGTWTPSSAFSIKGNGLYPYITGFNVDEPDVFLSLVPIILPDGATLSNMTSVNAITLGGQAYDVTWSETERVGIGSSSGYTMNVPGQCYVVQKATKDGYSRVYVLQCDKDPLLGTEANPFTIDSLPELTYFRDNVNGGLKFIYKHFQIPMQAENTYFKQTVDITMPTSNWDCIGFNSAIPFKGIYDGGNHAVIGFTRTGSDMAFFRYTEGATVKNLTVRNNKTTANTASLIYSMRGGKVDNCHAEGATIRGGLIFETAVGDWTDTIMNSTNSNNITLSSSSQIDRGGIVSQVGADKTFVINCHNYGNITGSVGKVGGVVGRTTQDASANLVVTGCSNWGTITNSGTNNESETGGVLGECSPVTITYSYNMGDVDGRANYVAGITALGSASYCYNMGTITGGKGQNISSRNVTVIGISRGKPTSCFNAGTIVNYSTGNAFGLSSSNSTDCFNAGEVRANAGIAYSEISSNTYSIGRLNGEEALIGGTYYDPARVPFYTSENGATSKTTAEMTSGSLSMGANWVEEAGLYPRIKGLDTLPISIALALPITFSNTTDDVDHVSANFDIANAYGIKWRIVGTSGATIADGTDKQTVTLPTDDRTKGDIILVAYNAQNDSICQLVLKMSVPVPTDLTVENVEDLQSLQAGINSGVTFMYKGKQVPAGGEGTTFTVTADFSFPVPVNGTCWDPIGTEENPFKGVFDGDGHTLSGLKQFNKNYTGMFGYVTGEIKNLNLADVDITGARYGGSLCGSLRGGTISNCTTQGSLTGGSTEFHSQKFIAGMVGRASQSAHIQHCSNYVEVTSLVGPYASAAGIVANCDNTCYVEYCINGASVDSAEIVAGICANGGIINYCVNYGDITGVPLSRAVAGISVRPDDTHSSYVSPVYTTVVTGCVNSGKISVPMMSASCEVAGVCVRGRVSNSYNVGQIDGSNATKVAGVYIGGYSPTYCYNAGQVKGSGDSLLAVSNCYNANCFYDTQMCTVIDSFATGKTTAEMLALTSAYLGDGFEYEPDMYPRISAIANIPASLATAAPVNLAGTETVEFVDNNFTMGGCIDHNVTWSIDGCVTINACDATIVSPGIPELKAAVNDTVYKVVPLQVRMDAFIIKDSTQLNKFRARINSGVDFYYNPADSTYLVDDTAHFVKVPALGYGKTFRVSNDINLNGQLWTPIGNTGTEFMGTFDGNEKTISNFVIKNRANTGLFGCTTDAEIKKLILDNVTSESITKENAGVLIGNMKNTTLDSVIVRNSQLSSNNNCVGGVAGYASSSHVFSSLVSNCEIEGAIWVGGYVGKWEGTSLKNSSIKNSEITGTGEYVGGIAGLMTQIGVSFHVTNVSVDTCHISGTSLVGGFAGQHSYSHGGTHTDISVRGGSVTGTSNNVGGLYGNASGVTLIRAYNSAEVTGNNNVGGLAGYKHSLTLTYSRNDGNVTGRDYVGGLVGNEPQTQHSQSVSTSVNTGKITGRNHVGGIRGISYQVTTNTVYHCVNLGEVEGNTYVGGILGSSMANSYSNVNAGKVHGENYVGGLVGMQSNYTGYSRKIHDSYSVGQVYGTGNVGNIVGIYDDGTVENCYYDKQMSPKYMGVGTTNDDAAGVAEGKLTNEMLGSSLSMTGFKTMDGIYPRPTPIADSAAAIAAASPVVLPDTITVYTIPGVNTFSMTPSTVNDVVWSNKGIAFTNASGTFTPRAAGSDVLVATKGDASKYLDFVVSMSKENPCVIKDQTQLNNFTALINSGSTFYYQTTDSTFVAESGLDPLSAIALNPGGADAFFRLDFDPDYTYSASDAARIGTPDSPFLGDFNGNNKTVTSLPIATSDTCGFFGVNGGTVYDLNFKNTKLSSAEHSVVGAVCGYNTGSISNCQVINGTVNGESKVGAVVGVNAGFVEDCHNSATVTGDNYVGGIVGENTNTVRRCFNMGEIDASAETETYLGGIAGKSTGSLLNTYNAGHVVATGSASQYVGGLVGRYNGSDFQYGYNIGEVTAPSTDYSGGIAGYVNNNLIISLAYDNQMCSQEFAFGTADGGADGRATKNYTDQLTGTQLQSLLGSDAWIYTDGLYPQLASLADLDASLASATPIFLLHGEYAWNVEHDFTVGIDDVVWTAENADGVLDLSNVTTSATMAVVRCGTPTVSVAKVGSVETKDVDLLIQFTASEVTIDTVCGGSTYTWEVNGITYSTTDEVIVSKVENGCPVTYTLQLEIPEELALTVTSHDQLCFPNADGEASVTVSGGFGPYLYVWTNEAGDTVSTNPAASNLEPGTYTIKVIDTKPVRSEGDECSVTETVVINPVTKLVTKIDSSSAGCYGVTDGMFQISVEGGMAPYTVSWTGTGSGSRTLNVARTRYEVNNLNNGTYTVTVTDDNGCTTDSTITFEEVATEYEIHAFSTSKMYDGDTVDAANYTLKIGATENTYASGEDVTLSTGDVLNVVLSQGKLVNAGEYNNEVSSYTITRAGEDVSCTYNVSTHSGTVSITKRSVTLTSADSTHYLPVPDCIRKEVVNVTGDGFATADASKISYNFTGEACGTEPTMVPNAFTVNWGDVNPDNYEVTINFGKLMLLETGTILVHATGLNKTYDGTELNYDQTAGLTYDVNGSFTRDVGGITDNIVFNNTQTSVTGLSGTVYTLEVVMNAESTISMKDADTVDNIVTSVVVKADGTPLTSGYTVITYDSVLQVNPRTITMTSSSDTWTYDGQAHSRPDITVEGSFVAADLLTAPAANVTATNVGTYTNEITYALQPGVQANNYTITKNEGTLEITLRKLYLEGVEKLVDYNGLPQQATDFTYGNLVDGHTASGITYLAEGTDVGNYDGVFSGTLVVKDASDADVTSNYDVDSIPSILGIQNPVAEIKVKSATFTKVYDGTVAKAQTYEVTYKGAPVAAVDDDFHFKLPTGDTLLVIPTGTGETGLIDAGTIQNSFDYGILPTDKYSYYTNVKLDTGTVTVTPRPVILTSASLTRPYDGTPIIANSVEVTGSLFVGEDSVICTYTNPGNWTEIGSYTNEFTYVAKGTTNLGNYNITPAYGTLKITKAILYVTAKDTARAYGEPDDFHYIISGFVSPDDESVITGSITYETTADQFSDIGTYPVTPVVTGLSATKYTFEAVSGTLTVVKREVTVKAASVTKKYDGTLHTQATDPTTVESTTNLATGDALTATFSYARMAAGSSQMNIASATITRDAGARDVTGNYTVKIDENSTLTLEKRNLTIVVDNASKNYDGTALLPPSYKIAAVDSLAVGDEIAGVTLTGSQISAGVSKSGVAEGYTITHPSLGDVTNSCYVVAVDSGTLTVTPVFLTIKLDTTKWFDGDVFVSSYVDDAQKGYTITGLVNGETITAGTVTSSSSALGVYKYSDGTATPSGFAVSSDIANYDVTYDLTMEIKGIIAPITISSANPGNITYDGQKHGDEFHQYEVTFDGNPITADDGSNGLIFTIPLTGDKLTINPTFEGIIFNNAVNDTANNNVFTYTIENESSYVGPRTITYGTVNIDPKPITITVKPEAATKVYDGDTLRVAVDDIIFTTLAEGDVAQSGSIYTDGFLYGDYTCAEGNFYAPVDGVAIKSGFEIMHPSGVSSLSSYTPKFVVTLKITKRPVTITAASAEKTYDCTPLTDNSFIVAPSLGTNDVLTADVNGSQTCTGESSNVVDPTSVLVMHDGSLDVTESYEFTFVDGILKINPITTGFTCPADITITLWHSTCDTNVTLTEEATLTPPLSCGTITNDLVNPLPAGAHTITWSLKDDCGNVMTTCQQLITVNYPKCDTAVDYDGNKYPSERIGCNCWTVPNLISEHYSDGTEIANLRSYNDSDSLENIYGKLYSWYSAARVAEGDDSAVPVDSSSKSGPYVEGICPAGWALPTVAEYLNLFEASESSAELLKSPLTTVWLPGKEGSALSKFKAFGAGYYDSSILRYLNLMGETHFWAADNNAGSATAKSFVLNYYCEDGFIEQDLKGFGYSIRCVQKK